MESFAVVPPPGVDPPPPPDLLQEMKIPVSNKQIAVENKKVLRLI
jgi:hypothetical protein